MCFVGHATVADIRKSESNCKDKGFSRDALLLFGFGDGGGGPNEAHLQQLQRLKGG